MRARAVVVAVLAGISLLGCDGVFASKPKTKPAPADAVETTAPSTPKNASRSSVRCTPDPAFPTTWQVAEASAAVELEPRPGEREILVLSDSGNHGEAMTWPVAGGPLTALHLELDTVASDDIEGAAWTDGHLFTLTSSGAVRRYTFSAKGYLVRDRSAYPIGPSPYVCDTLYDGNCGKNYEGLCLRASTKKARCAGYAASKTEGTLQCVVLRAGTLAIDTSAAAMTLDVPRNALSDCAFGSAGGPAEDTLVVTTNIYGGSTTYVVDEASGSLSAIDVHGTPNNEAIAIDRTGALYQFMDSNTSASSARREICTGWSSSPSASPAN